MSVLRSVSISSPIGRIEECAQFTIETFDESFTMFGAMVPNQEQTLRCWLRSDAIGSLTINGTTIPTTTSWAEYKITFTPATDDLVISFVSVGVYYIYHAQIELGNKASDWNPAPEDIDEQFVDTQKTISEVITRIVDAETAIITDSERIALCATKTEVEESLGNHYTKEQTDSLFDVQSEQIDMRFTTTTERVEEVDGELQKWVEQYSKYINFSDDGILIGSSDSPVTLQIDNEEGIVFKKGDTVFGYWNGSDFYTGNIVVQTNERAQFGNFAFMPRPDGSLSFLKVATT